MNIVTLSNGKRVANFSSPHPFTFEDGTILPAVSNEKAEELKVTFIEEEAFGLLARNGDISLRFDLSEQVLIEMERWEKLWQEGKVDVVFCPLPMIQAMKDMDIVVLDSPFRAIRLADRIKKLASISKQCI